MAGRQRPPERLPVELNQQYDDSIERPVEVLHDQTGRKAKKI